MHWWCECKMTYPLWKMAWQFPKVLNVIKSPYDPAIPLRIQYIPKKKKMCVPIMALFITPQKGRQRKCPPTNGWIKKCGTYLHNGIFVNKKTLVTT